MDDQRRSEKMQPESDVGTARLARRIRHVEAHGEREDADAAEQQQNVVTIAAERRIEPVDRRDESDTERPAAGRKGDRNAEAPIMQRREGCRCQSCDER